jgi:hypothetical protein
MTSEASTITIPSEKRRKVLDEISLLTANFGDGPVIREVLNDWLQFLGGRPGQIILADNGSDRETQQSCWECYRDGLIDKLLLVSQDHCDTGRDLTYIIEHAAPAIATKPYVLFFKIDSLPYRRGYEDWIVEAIEYLERPDTFAIGGSFNVDSRHHDAWPGWYFSDRCSENFALMKRERFIAAMEQYAGSFISSGFRGTPPTQNPDESHYLIELAFETYMKKHGLYTLAKVEDPNWTIFHTNVHGQRLREVRQRYMARCDVARYMNAKHFSAKFPHGVYYGRPHSLSLLRRARIALGASRLGPFWRHLKRRLNRAETAT